MALGFRKLGTRHLRNQYLEEELYSEMANDPNIKDDRV